MTIAECFAIDGPVHQAVREITGRDYYHPREEQIRFAELIEACFDKGALDQGDPTHVLPAQGETGVGKLLATLVAIMRRLANHRLNGETNIRGGYASYTRALLRQANEKDVKIARRAVEIETGVRLEVALYYGAAQFLSIGALDSIDADLSAESKKRTLSRQENIALTRVRNMRSTAESGSESLLLVDLKARFGVEEYEPLLPGYSDIALAGDYREVSDYPQYKRMREEVYNADLVLMSTAAALLNGYRNFALVEDMAPMRYLIVDEAHKIPDAAQNIYNRSVSLRRLRRLTEACTNLKLGDASARQKAHDAAKKAFEALVEAHPSSPKKPREDKEARILVDDMLPNGEVCRDYLNETVGLESLVEIVGRYARGIKSKGQPVENKARETVLSLKNLMEDLRDIETAVNRSHRYRQVGGVSWTPYRGWPSLVLTTLYPGHVFARYWRHYPAEEAPEDARNGHLWAAVVTSATLPDLRDIGLFSGLDRNGNPKVYTKAWQVPPEIQGVPPEIHGEWGHPVRIEPKRRFGRMSFILSSGEAPKTMGAPEASQSNGVDEDRKRYVSRAWEENHLVPMILCALDSMEENENGLLLTPSFDDLDRIQTLLADHPNVHSRLVYQGREATLSAKVEEFKAKARAGERALLLTTGGWEGLDLPGLVNHLIIARIPKPPQDELWEKAYRSAYPEKDPSEAKSIVLKKQNDAAFSKLRQGLGRGIRQASDRCTVWVADKSFGILERTERLYDDDAIRASTTRRTFTDTVAPRFKNDLVKARFFDASRGVFTPLTQKAALEQRRRKMSQHSMGAGQQASV